LDRTYALRALSLTDDVLSELFNTLRAAAMISQGIRKNVHLIISFENEGFTIIFDSSKLKRVSPDDSSLSGVFRKIFAAAKVGKKIPHWGVTLRYQGFFQALKDYSADVKTFYESKNGVDIRKLVIRGKPRRFIFAVFLQSEWCNEEKEYLVRLGFKPLRPSRKLIKPSQLITLVNNELDQRGF